ncbi:MAG: SLBB domain-containing protein, partial [Candidatus Eremiobacteraeota bacterium]|nr:SLBB domain-containing protein [Candidatus Eremiobacteraeota bacterium]
IEKQYTIRVDGSFFHPIIGDVRAAGRTVEELKAEVGARLSKELKNPAFRLGLKAYAVDEVAVLGEVTAQGKFPIRKGATLMELLAQAGGLNEKADRQFGTLMRNGQNITVSLRPARNDPPFKLEPGDILYVHAGLRVAISGEVMTPGVYSISRSSTDPIADVLKAAGGPKTTAALGRVKLMRPTLPAPQVLDIVPKQAGQVVTLEPLEDGDTLVVPPRQAMLLGGVAEQGALALEGGESLIDVISASKLSPDAKLDEIIVVRAEDVKAGRDKKEIYNLQQFFESHEDGEAVKVPILDGDLVYVPVKVKSEGGILGNSGFLNLLIMARSFFL